MSDHANDFIQHLQTLKSRDRGALATLRHSLAFDPGTYPKAFPYVERFAGNAVHAGDARRLALYAVAGLYARHPEQCSQSFATAFGELMRRKESASIEQRFIALLEADPENITDYLRQSVSLLASESIGFDYSNLLDDLSRWMNHATEQVENDRIRQRWARDFYRALQSATDSTTTSTQ